MPEHDGARGDARKRRTEFRISDVCANCYSATITTGDKDPSACPGCGGPFAHHQPTTDPRRPRGSSDFEE